MVNYLDMVKQAGIEKNTKNSMLIFADDQFVVRQAMQVYFDELGILNRVMFCRNGEEVVQFFKNFFKELQANTGDLPHQTLQPVTLLLMDINMPIKNGLEATREVKELFDLNNEPQAKPLLPSWGDQQGKSNP